jgi:hypothetical protein
MNWEPVVVQTKAGPTRTMAPRPADTLEELPLPKVETSWTSYYRNIMDTIDGKAELIVTIPSVRRVLRLIEACFESDEKGEGVKTDIFTAINVKPNNRQIGGPQLYILVVGRIIPP